MSKKSTIPLNYQLGMMVGEYIVALHLPTLSTDMLKSRKIIQVSEEETAEWETLQKNEEPFYFINRSDEQEEEYLKLFYENRKWYHKLEEKYLPETIKVPVPRVEPTNINRFGEGIESALWNCDMSHYRIQEGFFEQTYEMAWCSYIILTRHIEKVPEKFA
jgi:hypothetical protein